MKNHVLIVDEQERNVEILKFLLEEEFDISSVPDTAGAISAVQKSVPHIDMVLVSLNLLCSDGFALLKYMRSHGYSNSIPIVAIADDGTSSSMEEAYSLGVTDFIPSSFEHKAVVHRVRNTLRLFSGQKKAKLEHRWYERRLDAHFSMNSDIAAVYLINLTEGLCIGVTNNPSGISLPRKSQSLEDLLEELSVLIISDSNRLEFLEKFSPDSLIKSCDSSQEISMRCGFQQGAKRALLGLSANVIRNASTMDVEAVLYVRDETDAYIEESVAHFLIEKGYDALGIIDLSHDLFTMLSFSFGDIEALTSGNASFNEGRRRTAMLNIAPEDRDKFLRNSEIENLRRMLHNYDSYSFHIRCLENGKKRFKKYTYHYLMREHDIVLATVEDISNEMERDDLTGYLNRRGFINYTEVEFAASKDRREYAILYFDVLDFKAINETFGSFGGDTVLRFIADQLAASFLKPAALARISGSDHFLCLTLRKNILTDRLPELLHFTHTINSKEFEIYMKCGIYFPDDTAIKVSGMCDCAKLATKNIVDTYVKPYAYYIQSLKDDYLNKAAIKAKLKRAFDNSEFQVYYQPVFDARTHRLASAEALVRWFSPDKGFISPAVFIPILEENGYISKLDLFVANSVESFINNRISQNQLSVPISVNLSGMDFNDRAMMEALLEAAKLRTDGALRYEITESCYFSMSAENAALVHELRRTGAKILIDDFGTGYSSFAIVADYEFDILKLDIGFVRKIGRNKKCESIIKAIIDMAHSIDVGVIAEGVETKEQADFLAEHSCDFIQGYYFSKPLPQNEFEALLNAT